MVGLSTIGSISLGCALVAGRNLVPSPAAGMIAFLTFILYPPIPNIVVLIYMSFILKNKEYDWQIPVIY